MKQTFRDGKTIDQYKTLIFEKSNNLATITLNRPEVVNAFNTVMRDELYEVLTGVNFDDEIKGILIKGMGAKGFCGGADLNEFGTAPSQYIARNIRKERDLWEVFRQLHVPVICVMHGYTFGSGVEIAMMCDVRIGSKDLIIGLPETSLGIIPAAGGTQTIPRQIRLGYALDLLLLAKQIDAMHALDQGLIDYCISSDKIIEFSYNLLKSLSSNTRELIKMTKTMVSEGLDLTLNKALDFESRKCFEYIIETRQW
jgi:enoyl-CoA hydratase/carnithine racemase